MKVKWVSKLAQVMLSSQFRIFLSYSFKTETNVAESDDDEDDEEPDCKFTQGVLDKNRGVDPDSQP